MRGATSKQRDILVSIAASVQDEGYAPSVRDLAADFRVYPATIQDHLIALERKGLISRKRGPLKHGLARALVITELGQQELMRI